MTEKSEAPPTLSAAPRHLFLSPHYDDIALSAGATVAQLADLGLTPRTIVVFGAEPDPAEPLSTFADAMHLGWGLSAGEVIARRRGEEAAAAAILGAGVRVLPFRDAIYRGQAYLSDEDLFGMPAATDDALPEAIIAALDLGTTPDPLTRIYAPLAIGLHVDHQIVFRAAAALARRGWEVWFYEDVPYALKPAALETRLAQIGESTVTPAALIPADAGWERKLDAILSYPSQLETIFRQYVGIGVSRDEIDVALTAYAADVGGEVRAERFWMMKEGRIAMGVDASPSLR